MTEPVQHNKASQPEHLGRGNLLQDHVPAEVYLSSERQRPRRRPGALRGKIRMASDFDVLPQDVQAAIEGDD